MGRASAQPRRPSRHRLAALCCAFAVSAAAAGPAAAQQASVSAWDAADFRIWGFIPDWTSQTQIDNFATNGMYTHVSDVIYFGGVRPNATGNLTTTSHAATALPKLKSQAALKGFNLHLCMKTVTGGTEDAVWNSISSNPANRANFVNKVKDVLVSYNMKGFNFDWERPATDGEWANYTQLAKDLRTAIHPLGMEISVDDYGFADPDWDDTPVFDAAIYDQLFIMGYHYPATSAGALDNENFADGKLALGDPDTGTAFTDAQLAIGVGTWGAHGPATVTLQAIVTANPNLPYDALTFTGTINDINGVSRTGTWDIESRKQVREKTQVALDRNMPGMFSWTLHYDATNELGLHRVMHHYAVFQRGIPDLNLDGRVNATDANTLANNMGTVPGWTGTNTAARFDDFYLSGNWEQGDRDGNGFVNQQDADWLAGRFGALGVTLPDRLAYSGTFENFQSASGLTGRWRAKRETGGNLRETGNFTQHGGGYLPWSGTGVGADKRSNYAVTLRNQNAAEAFDRINTLPRVMTVDLATPIDLAQEQETYFTFLVRQNTGPLLASQLASNNRTLSLEFLNGAGANQFDFSFRGLQQQLAIQSQADAAGQDVAAGGFLPDTTYLFVGKIAGNGVGANTMQASLFTSGATVGNYAADSFPWLLTAQSSSNFNPVITQLQFTSLYEANYTVSNVWIGTAADFFALPSAAMGDFNNDGMVDAADYLVWRSTMGQSGILLAADGNGNGEIDDGDYDVWRAHFGESVAGSGSGSATSGQNAVPEPKSLLLLGAGAMLLAVAAGLGRQRSWS
ncbi:MAG: glycosyl hydrolase family 18 protein [Pirellulales bacterium]